MINATLDRCLSFINSQSAPKTPVTNAVTVRHAVTISRQAGCGGVIVAEKLANYLQQHAPAPNPSWTVFDRELMNQVLADHNLPAHLEKFLPEDRLSAIEDILADIFSVRPTSQTLVQQTAETILKLAELGNVILVGRAGNIVTAPLPRVLHVRLVAPLEPVRADVARVVEALRNEGFVALGALLLALGGHETGVEYAAVECAEMELAVDHGLVVAAFGQVFVDRPVVDVDAHDIAVFRGGAVDARRT